MRSDIPGLSKIADEIRAQCAQEPEWPMRRRFVAGPIQLKRGEAALGLDAAADE